jgi:hypothetical protein
MHGGKPNLDAGPTVRLVAVAAVLVVHEQAAVGDGLEELGLGVLEVELGEPVVREVLSGVGRR